MKKFSLFILFCSLLCGLSVAKANIAISFQDDIQDIACAIPHTTIAPRSISFLIENNSSLHFNDLMLYLQHAPEPLEFASLVLDTINCGAIVNHSLGRVSLAPQEKCEGTMRLTAAVCPELADGSYSSLVGTMTRTLALNHFFADPVEINVNVTPLGAAGAFGLLSPEIDNDDGYGPVEVSYGAVGSLATVGTIHVANGSLYPDNAEATFFALQDLSAAYQMFQSHTSCTVPEYELSNTVLMPGSYCLNGHSVINQSKLTLQGEGTYVFYVDGEGFYLGPNAAVLLTEGANANNVYWVVDNRLHLSVGSIMTGNILGGESIPYGMFAGARSRVNGRVLSLDTLNLYGNTVRVPR